jgi:hypothetical protein
MIVIEKIKKGFCCFCHEPASVKINSFSFCSSCGDGELLKVAYKCVKAVKHATVTLKIIPSNKNDKCKNIQMQKTKTMTKTWTLSPDQGTMFLYNSAPEGYKVVKIDRKKTKAVVTYQIKET